MSDAERRMNSRELDAYKNNSILPTQRGKSEQNVVKLWNNSYRKLVRI